MTKIYISFIAVFILLSSQAFANEVVCRVTNAADMEKEICIVSGPSPEEFTRRVSMLKDGLKDGQTTVYYPPSACAAFNNQVCIAQEQMYQAGKKHGIGKKFFMVGKIQEEANYNQDLLDGEMKVFSESGNLKAKAVYAQGDILSPMQWFDDKGNPRQGEFIDEDQVGYLKIKSNYNNGYKDGVEKIYGWQEEDVQSLTEYKMGVKEGLSKVFLAGILKEEITYLGNKRNGPYRQYQEGKVILEVNYSNDQKDGVEKYYHADGYLLSQTPYVKGVIEGKRTIYYPSGKVKFIDNYEQGVRVGELQEFPDQ